MKSINKKITYDNVWLRTAVNLIPYIGSSLDVILSHKLSEFSKTRIKYLLDSLESEMKNIQENLIDKEYLETEEWMDIVRLSMEKAIRIRNKNRIILLSKILCGSATNEILKIGHPEDLIDVISEINDEEFLILIAIVKLMNKGVDFFRTNDDDFKEYIPEKLHDRIYFLTKRIEKTGILNEVVATITDYSGGSFELTVTGKELLKYLSDSILY